MARPTTDIPNDPLAEALAMSSSNALAKLAVEGGQLSLEQQRTLFGDVMTAQPCKLPRDEARILQRIDRMAGAAGTEWFYRFPVKNRRKGTVDYIEGPSIECTDAVARYYGNCQLASAVVDLGNYWIIHSRFVDLETGFTLIRPFLQGKAATLGGDDETRGLQIALSTGTSKSQRNVVDHALRDFTRRAFEGAKRNLVERIGRNMDGSRAEIIKRLEALDVPVARVERVYGRKAAEWLATDIARMAVEIKTINDGMATVDETWPLAPPPEPRRSDVVDESSGGADPSPHGAAGPAAGDAPLDVSASPADAASQPAAPQPAPPSGPPLWIVGDNIIGQPAILARLRELIGQAQSAADLDSITTLNADKIAKFGAGARAQFNTMLASRRLELHE